MKLCNCILCVVVMNIVRIVLLYTVRVCYLEEFCNQNRNTLIAITIFLNINCKLHIIIISDKVVSIQITICVHFANITMYNTN